MGIIVSVVGGVISVVFAGTALGYTILVASMLLGMDALMLWVLYGTGYTITSDQLLIRCGPFSFRVVLNDIAEIIPTRNPLSSPACSLDRLKVVYGYSRQSLMISPKNKPEFLSAIVQNSPSLIALHNQVWKKEISPSSSFDSAIQPETMI